MKILNLGCGTKTSVHADVENIDFSFKLRIRQHSLLRSAAKYLVSESRWKSIDALPQNILVHNLKKGIPYADGSIDVIFHSHLIEHIERREVERFIKETHRVLKNGGVLRVVFPDMEKMCREYLAHLEKCNNKFEKKNHEIYIANIIEQIARVESSTTSSQPFVRRRLENLILGDARRKGEAHMWMYDRVTLEMLLIGCGFKTATEMRYNESIIEGWPKYGLDTNPDGSEYRPMSGYIEAVK